MRLDLYLTENGFFPSRSRAQSAIASGNVIINGVKAPKPSLEINGTEKIEITSNERFVSRAGDKLQKAIEAFSIDVNNLIALDIGASTGGFTDCLLQNGAEFVYSLDVG